LSQVAQLEPKGQKSGTKSFDDCKFTELTRQCVIPITLHGNCADIREEVLNQA